MVDISPSLTFPTNKESIISSTLGTERERTLPTIYKGRRKETIGDNSRLYCSVVAAS